MGKLRHVRGELLRRFVSVVLCVAMTVEGMPPAAVAYALDEVAGDSSSTVILGADGEGEEVSGETEGSATLGEVVPQTAPEVTPAPVEEPAPEVVAEPEPEHVRVVFETGVGEGDAHPVTGTMESYDFVMDGEIHALPGVGFVREGFEFVGWSTTRDGKDIKDDPATEADESFKALLLPDALEMVDLGYDELVEDKEVDAEGNEVVVSTHLVPRNLDYAKRSGEVKLYAQWREIVVETPVEEAPAEEAEVTEAPEQEAPEAPAAEDEAKAEPVKDEDEADVLKDSKAEETKPEETADAEEEGSEEQKPSEESIAESVTEDMTNIVENVAAEIVSGVSDKETTDELKSEDASEGKGEDEVSASVAVGEGDVTGVVVTGETDDVEEIADAIAASPEISRSTALGMAKRLSAPLKMPVPAEDENVPRQLDGSFIENISVSWVTEDTADNGDDALLYKRPSTDAPFSVRAVVDYALSGEHDYNAGDIVITVPANVFTNRDGTSGQGWVYPYPQEPERSADFMWSRVGNTIVFTNTHRLPAATKGYIEFDMTGLVPHKLVDRRESDPFWARIEVLTHRDNTIGLSSSEITAEVDTEERITDAFKNVGGSGVSIVPANQIPAAARVPGETEYVVVPWYAYGYVQGNTEFTVSMVDELQDEYEGTIIYPAVGDTYEKQNVFSGYVAGNADGSEGTAVGGTTIRVAYPLSQFEPDVVHTFKNKVTYTLTEKDPAVGSDPQLVTTQVANGLTRWSWSSPKFKDPTGHFMIQKYGNDNSFGRAPWNTHYAYNRSKKYLDNNLWNESSPYFGEYPSALNDLRDNESVELSYTMDTTGFLLPWTLDGDPRVVGNYGKRSVVMVSTDTDETASRPIRFGSLDLVLGRDYDYKAVEFPVAPRVYRAQAINLNPDGSFSAEHAGDGTVNYRLDSTKENIPDVMLEAKVNGEWQNIATASWKTGRLIIIPQDGIAMSGIRVMLPEGTSQIRTTVNTNVAGVEYHVRPIIELKTSDEVLGVVENLFDNNMAPHANVYNTTYLKAYDDGGHEIADIHKQGYDELGGYSVDTAVVPSKTFEQVAVDQARREVRVHYAVTVDERSYIPGTDLYEQAVADGYITPDTSGVFYDLLPVGMDPVTSTVKLRDGDIIRDVSVEHDWRGTGRTMLIVEADLSPHVGEWSDNGTMRMRDRLKFEFDATYPFESIIDFGEDTHNVVAYESLVKEPLGTVRGSGAEPDDPRSSNNVKTSQAFVSDEELDALTGLDSSRGGERFVYAGVSGTVTVPGAARTSLAKDIQVNNDGRWSYGTYEDKRTVYEGGVYSYRLRMMSDRNTISRDLIMYDSLENFYAADGNDEADINAPRWRGEFVAVDTLQLRLAGCAPVVYYSTVDELQLADESDKNKANDTNTNLADTSIWVKASDYMGDLADVHAVAIDCSLRADGTPFELAPGESATAVLRMHAPHGEPAREYIAEDAHAYNNIYLKCTSVDKTTLVPNSNNFVRHDYTKVGLEEFKLVATKVWDDDSDRDGIRPDSVLFQLTANGEAVGEPHEVTGPDWQTTFENIPYTDENGQYIKYRIDEIEPEGYDASISIDGNKHTITNVHEPEKIRIRGTKTWVGGTAGMPQSVVVGLLADGVLVATKTVTASSDGEWKYDFGERVKYRTQGQEVIYSVVEMQGADSWRPIVNGLDIENEYHPYGDLRISKTVVGATEAYRDRRFEVRVQLTDIDGNELDGEFAYETTDGRTGTFRSGDVIELAGGESATILEVPEYTKYVVTESAPAGYVVSYNNNRGTIIPNKTNLAELKNTYSATGFVNLDAKKVLEGRTLKRYQFRFDVFNEDGELLRTASNKADGSVVFGAINYTQSDVGEHTYIVRETQRDMAGYTFDEREYKAIVTVSDLGNGMLSVDKRYEDSEGEPVDVPLFENTYHAEGSVKLKAWKRLVGRTLEAGEFSFELLDEGGRRVGLVATNDATGEVNFAEMFFDESDAGKTYKYAAHEIAGDDAGVNYDESVYGYSITVVDNGDGTLSFAQDMSEVSGEVVRALLSWDDVGEDVHAQHVWYVDGGRRPGYIYAPGYQSILDIPELGLTEDDFEFSPINRSAAILYDITKSGTEIGFANNYVPTYTEYQAAVDAQTWSGRSGGIAILYLSESGARKVAAAGIPVSTNYGGAYGALMFSNVNTDRAIVDRRLISAYQRGPIVALDFTDAKFTVEGSVDTVPVFTNTLKPGSLRIEKHVEHVDSAHAADQFRFKVKLTGEDVANLENLDYTREQIAAPTGTIMPCGVFDGLGMMWDAAKQLFSVRSAYAADDIASGKIGVGPTGGIDWRVTADGELILGDGTQNQMFYNNSPGSLPWYSVKEQITSARVNGTVKVFNDAATGLFSNLPNAVTIDVTGLDTSEATVLTNLFGVATSCEEIRGLDTLDTSNVVRFDLMFARCSSIKSLDLHTFDVSHAATLGTIFGSSYSDNLTACEYVNLSGWSNETVGFVPRDLFSRVPNCREIDVSGWNFPAIGSINQMFYPCRNVERVDVTGMNTSHVTDFYGVFYGCRALEEIRGLDTWDTSLGVNFGYMFDQNYALKDLDLSTFDVSKGTNFTCMLRGLKSCKNINLSGWKFRSVPTNGSIQLCGSSTAYWEYIDASDWWVPSAYPVKQYGCFGTNSDASYNGYVIDVSGWEFGNPSDFTELFYNSYAKSIIGLGTWDTSQTYVMYRVFEHMPKLTYLDLSGFDTSNVVDMHYMCANMPKLEAINLTGLETQNVRNFYAMFSGDLSLRELNVSSFDVSNGTNFNSMFSNLPQLERIYSASNADWSRQAAGSDGSPFSSQDSMLSGGEGTIVEDVGTSMYFARVDGLADPDGNESRGLFTAGIYSITFDANGGSGSMSIVYRFADSDASIPRSSLRRFGYVQTGWEDQNGNVYSLVGPIPAGTYAEGGHAVLKAVWEEEVTNVNLEDGEFYVTLCPNEAVTFEDCLPAGIAYSVFEETSEGWVLVSQSNTSGNIMPAETSLAEFTNRYDEASTSVSFGGLKTLDGRGAEGAEFRFALYEGEQLIESVYNEDGGGITFAPIIYGEGDVGMHTYTVKEIAGNNPNVVYDSHVETITVEVTQNGRNLSAVTTYDADGMVFANETLPGAIEITKLTEGGGDPNQEFEFEIELKGVTAAVGAPDGEFDALSWLVDSVKSLFSPRMAYAVTDGWNAFGECEWRVRNKTLIIRPADGAAEGNLPSVDGGYGWPWNANDVKDTFESVRFEGTVRAANQFRNFLSNCSNLKTVDFHGLDTSGSTSVYCVLINCPSLGYVDLSPLDVSHATSSSGLVQNITCDVLDLSNMTFVNPYQIVQWSRINKIVADGMKIVGGGKAFRQLSDVSEISLTNLDLSECTSLYSFFEYSGGFKRVKMSSAGTSAVTSMSDMFYCCSNLESVDFSGLDTSNVTNMARMFESVPKLSHVDISGLNTSNVTNMNEMFHGASSLESLDLSNFDMSSVTDMSYMFAYCSSLHDITFGHISAPNLSNAGNMFANCGALESIYTSNDTDLALASGANFSGAFSGCNSLVGSAGTSYAETWESSTGPSAMPQNYVHVDGVDGRSGLFSGTGSWLRFDANGGMVISGTDRVQIGVGAHEVTPPRVARVGSVLVGWNTKSDGTGESFAPDGLIPVSAGGSRTLYAQWLSEGEAHSYTVVHRQESISGDGTFTEIGRETRHSAMLEDVKVLPNSYWGFESPEAQTVDIAEDGSTEVVFDYTRKRVTLVYVFDDGRETTQVVLGGVRTPLLDAPVIEGKRFAGWADGPNGENGFYASGQLVNFDEGTTLYAKYVDEGSVYPSTGDRTIRVRVKAGETVRVPDIPAGTVYTVREVNVPDGWREVSLAGGSGVVNSNSTAYVSAKNAYSSSGKFDIVAHKSLVGAELVEGDFSFELVDGSGNVVGTAVNGGADTAENIIDALSGDALPNPNFGTGAINFRDIQVSSPGTYTYTIREVAGTNNDIVYDSHAETVTVVATDAGNGTLACTVNYDADGANFVNRVKPPEERIYEGASGNLSISKEVLQGPSDQTFAFDVEVLDADGNPVNAAFETRVYDGGTDKQEVTKVWHTPNLNDDGTKISDYASAPAPGPSSQYRWYSGVLTIPGAESMTLDIDYSNVRGQFRIWAGDMSGEPGFTTGAYSDAWSPNTAVKSYSYVNGGDNTLLHDELVVEGDTISVIWSCHTFDPLTYPQYNEWSNYGVIISATAEADVETYEAGSVTFTDGVGTIEVADGQTKHIVGLPAGATYRVVEQARDGWRQVTVDGNEGTIPESSVAHASFGNSYMPEGSFSILGKKIGVGLDVTEGAYDFELYDKDDLVSHVTNDAEGNIRFENLPIDLDWVGTTRTYTISEIPGDDDMIAWDTHAETVNVTFADDGEGHLTADVVYDADGCVFTNERMIPLPVTGLGGIPFSTVAYGLAAVGISLSAIAVRRRRRKA